MLKNLEGRELVVPVLYPGATRKKGDFPEEKVQSLRFGTFAEPTLFN